MIKDIIFAGSGYVIGSFTPRVLRKIKSLFVKESKALVTNVKAKV